NNIKKSIVGIIPMSVGSGSESVTVTPFTNLPVSEDKKTSLADEMLAWATDHANAIGISILGIIGLLIVRSIVRSFPRADTNKLDAYSASSSAKEIAEPGLSSNAKPVRRPGTRSASLRREELVDLVREDPDAAANVLRNWIGSAS